MTEENLTQRRQGAKKPGKDLDQKYRIERALEEKGHTKASLAREIGAPYGSVTNNIAGYKSDPELQSRIAVFLGFQAAALFGGQGGNHERSLPPKTEKSIPKNKPLKPQGFFFFLRRFLVREG